MHRLALIASLLLLAAAPARAADAQRMYQDVSAAAGCGAALAGGGQHARLKAPLDEATRGGLMAGIFLTLYDPTGAGGWDTLDWDKAPACPHARFTAQDVVWTLHAGAGSGPIRWARAPDRSQTFVLMKGPSLADAAAWNGARVGFPSASAAPAYYLVALVDQLHFVVQVYDGPPSLRLMADDIADLVEQRGVPLAVHDGTADAITLFLETKSGQQGELFRPQELSEGGAALLFAADGQYFQSDENQDAILYGSHFACPAAYDGSYKRDRLAVGDARKETVSLACQWRDGDDGILTIWVTRRPDASGDKAAFEQRIRAVEQDTGVAKRLTGPPTGKKAALQAGRNWINKDGDVEVDLFARQGEYVYEIRQSHTVQSLDAASKVLMAAIAQVSAPPERSIDAWSAKR